MVVKFNFLSKYLGMQTNVTMCLPSFSFADVMSDRKEVYVQGMKYQTLYLLHGGSGDDSDYVNFSYIVRYADDHKLAVVMPCDYNGEYTDVPKGPKYLKYIMEELIPLTRAFFPLSDKREDTFVGGLSMGAAGAMKNCPHLPGAVFGSADHVGRCKASGHPEAGFPLCHAENGAGAR